MSRPSTTDAPALTHPITFNGGEAEVTCAPGESLLLAGLRGGLNLPYECASGGCGSCKARLVGGRVTSRWPDATGLTERDHRRGDRILLCQSVPEGPVEVRAPWASEDDPLPTPARHHGVLAERTSLSADTALFVVELAVPLEHLPGQFVQLEFPDGARRAYSMTRPRPQPDDAHRVELLIRAKPGGSGSSWLFERLAVGDALTVEGPYGRAYARLDADRPVLCLAGGTGMAPVLAIATAFAQARTGRAVSVYVGARTLGDLVLADRFAALREAGVHVVAGVDVGEPGWRWEHDEWGEVRVGLALDHLVDDLVAAADGPGDLSGHDLYLGGPTPMIDAALRRLVREGTARADRVFLDRFA